MVSQTEEECPLLLTQRIILGKWKLSIIWFLAKYKVMRYSELQRAFDDPTLTQKMLTQHLKDLERDKVVLRKSYNQVTPKVEYSLTVIGESFIPVLNCMENWGTEYMKNLSDL